tara:strand:- start:25511 stop:26227 length:717 start_codon:yes stop_codon:yes gene_type:complete
MQASVEQVSVGSNVMDVYTSVPEGTGPFPAMVVIMNAFGVAEFTKSMCDKFAGEGYLAVAPDLFHTISDEMSESLGKTKRELLDDMQIISDVEATLGFLNDNPLAKPDKLGITGFCCGGRITWLMAAVSNRFQAAVPYYGGNLFAAWGQNDVTPFDRTADIDCPILFHFGENDDNPSQQDMLTLDKELTRLGKDYRFYSYPEAGHAFLDFTDPTRHNKRASDMSWPRTLEFLERHLKD